MSENRRIVLLGRARQAGRTETANRAENEGFGSALVLVACSWMILRGLIYTLGHFAAPLTDQEPPFKTNPLYELLDWLPAWGWGTLSLVLGIIISVLYRSWRNGPASSPKWLSLSLLVSGVYHGTLFALMFMGNMLSAGWAVSFIIACCSFVASFAVTR